MKYIYSFLIFTIAIIGFSFNEVSAKGSSGNDSKTIGQKVEKQIKLLPYYGVFDIISFEVEGSTVVLAGQVYHATNRNSAERTIQKIEGVENVVNNIEVLPYSRFDDRIRHRTVKALSRVNVYRYLQGNNPSMRIIVKRGHVSLEGFVRTRGDSRIAYLLASGVNGTFSVTNNLIITKEQDF